MKYPCFLLIFRIDRKEVFPDFIGNSEDPVILTPAVLVHFPCISCTRIINMYKCRFPDGLHMFCHIIGRSAFQIRNCQIKRLPKPLSAVGKHPPQQLVDLNLSFLFHRCGIFQNITQLLTISAVSEKSSANGLYHHPFSLPGQHRLAAEAFIEQHHMGRKPPNHLSLSHNDIEIQRNIRRFQCIQKFHQSGLRAGTAHGINDKQYLFHPCPPRSSEVLPARSSYIHFPG